MDFGDRYQISSRKTFSESVIPKTYKQEHFETCIRSGLKIPEEDQHEDEDIAEDYTLNDETGIEIAD